MVPEAGSVVMVYVSVSPSSSLASSVNVTGVSSSVSTALSEAIGAVLALGSITSISNAAKLASNSAANTVSLLKLLISIVNL